jgi:hypothetical protein
VVELLPSKYEAMSSNPSTNPSSKKKVKRSWRSLFQNVVSAIKSSTGSQAVFPGCFEKTEKDPLMRGSLG